jgi:hypothetical protein
VEERADLVRPAEDWDRPINFVLKPRMRRQDLPWRREPQVSSCGQQRPPLLLGSSPERRDKHSMIQPFVYLFVRFVLFVVECSLSSKSVHDALSVTISQNLAPGDSNQD